MKPLEGKLVDKSVPWHGFMIGKRRFGWEHSTIKIQGEPYMERWLLFVGGISLRLHKFYRGDDLRAPHDHPFWFVTFPLTAYYEKVFVPISIVGPFDYVRRVRAFRFNWRPAEYRHVVLGSRRICGFGGALYHTPKPFYTFCIAGYVGRAWGFWPTPHRFVYWRDWDNGSSY